MHRIVIWALLVFFLITTVKAQSCDPFGPSIVAPFFTGYGFIAPDFTDNTLIVPVGVNVSVWSINASVERLLDSVLTSMDGFENSQIPQIDIPFDDPTTSTDEGVTYSTVGENIAFRFYIYGNITAYDTSLMSVVPDNIVGGQIKMDCFDHDNAYDLILMRSPDDGLKPNVTLVAPPNMSIKNMGNLTFNYTVTDNSGISYCTLFTNNSASWRIDYNDTDPRNNSANNMSVFNLLENTFLWNIFCQDRWGLSNYADYNYSLSIQLPLPNVTLINPRNNTLWSQANVTLSYNVSVEIGSVTNCSLVTNNVLNQTSTTVTLNATQFFNWTNVMPSANTWYVNCTSSDGKVGQSLLYNLTIAKKVYWITPTNATPLEIGLGEQGGSAPNATRKIHANLSQDNVSVWCITGSCSTISSNWTALNMTDNQEIGAFFSCATASAGSFAATFRVNSSADGAGNLLQANCSIGNPDLTIAPDSIQFSNNTPAENQNITINATIVNLGGGEVSQIIVSFFDGNYTFDDNFANVTISTLGGLSNTTVSTSWLSEVGDHDIFVVVDPPVATSGSIAEVDETNNYNSSFISNSFYHTTVGNLSGDLTLSDASNRTVFTWQVLNNTDSNIYVVDVDSAVDWASLWAIGREAQSFTAAVDDFSEIDTLLVINGTQTINSTYTSDGVAIASINLPVFGSIINNVPIRNSTNSSLFITGILWDTSDGVGLKFNTSLQQDLVFVTKSKEKLGGKYGIYDYEISYPANLRHYKGPDSNQVAFYIELK